MRRLTYSASLVILFLLPALFMWHALALPIPLAQLAAFLVFVTVVGAAYDVWAARHGNGDSHWLWSFNGADTLGIVILDLPVEEYLFYTVSAFYLVVAWEVASEGYVLVSFEHLGVLVGAALWSLACVAFGFSVTGYAR